MCARTLAEHLFSDDGAAKNQNQRPVPSIAIQRRIKQFHMMESHPASKHPSSSRIAPYQDTLAVMTAYTKTLSDAVYSAIHQFQKSNYYTVLTRTTQPAHAVLFVAVLTALWCLARPATSPQSASPAAAMLHLGCFAAHFGAQLWMTFVSGLSLYFSLPRHHFGAVQRVLFPRYFALNAALSMGTLLGFARQHPASAWDPALALQGATLAMCFVAELAVRLYLTDPLVSLISAKEAIEAQAGVGSEVGHQDMGSLVNCPHYTRLHKAFRRVHSIIAVANMACLASSALHLHFLAHRLAALT